MGDTNEKLEYEQIKQKVKEQFRSITAVIIIFLDFIERTIFAKIENAQ